MGRPGKDRLRARMGKDNDGLGQKGAGHQFVQVSPGLGYPDENGTNTV